MAEQGMFKTVMRGFRKEDVLRYIDEMMEEHSAQEQVLEKQLAELRTQLAEAQVEAEAVAENERLTAEVAEQKQRGDLLAAQVDDVTAQIEQVRNEALASEQRNAELTVQIEQLNRTIAQLQEEKAILGAQLAAKDAVLCEVRSLGEAFCEQVKALLPTDQPTAFETTSC